MFKHALMISILCISLTACGFHLRGNYKLSSVMHEIVLESENSNDGLTRALKAALGNAGAVLLDKPSDASALLVISGENTGRRVLSVGADGRAQEYEVYSTVLFALSYPDIGDQPFEDTLTVTREYAFDSSNVLGANSEEEILRDDIENALVELIMRRLSAVTPAAK